jgi:hypothetical protein
MYPRFYNINKGICLYLHVEQLVINVILPAQYPMNIGTENRNVNMKS